MELKIGQKARVINYGSTYTTYSKMFNELKFVNQKENRCWDNGEIGVIFGIGEHCYNGLELIALRHRDGRETLIGKDGIEIVDSTPMGKAKLELFIKNIKIGDTVRLKKGRDKKEYFIEEISGTKVYLLGKQKPFTVKDFDVVQRRATSYSVNIGSYVGKIDGEARMLEVGCQKIPFSQVEEIYLMMKHIHEIVR